jgi:dihydroxyacetone kinase-like protein
MRQSLDATDFVVLLEGVVADLKEHAEELRKLDAIVGDGDLGVTVELAVKAISEYLLSQQERDIGKLLMNCGLNINRVSPSTFGTVLANAFMGAGKAVLGKAELETKGFTALGEGAVESIKKRGKAEVGDKTVLDALVPAVECFKKELSINPATALDSAIRKGEQGMRATADMKAKFGRAQWFQEKSIGVQDGGATALYYMMESFVRHLKAL